jgi:prolyl-tRNA synthetase
MKQSELFTKTRKVISAQEQSINAQLLERAGYVSKLMAGVFTYLPLGNRVLTKIEAIVRKSMNELGAQEILMPSLHPKEPWQTTGRWDTVDVLYKLKAGDRELGLGPTHEEIVTPLAASYISSYKDLPQAVYQIQTKFRNEARPKSGLLRGREFRMKDLYSFHAVQEDLDTYYDKVTKAYVEIFKECGLGDITYFTYASGGTFSKYSHEFQAVTPYGEDTIFVCDSCRVAINQEIIQEQSSCPQCGSSTLNEKKSIEVGNIFKLQTRFSEPFKLTYRDAQDKEHSVLMGCYGLGTTRLMGAIVEALHDENGICWPAAVAPYDFHVLDITKEQENRLKVLEFVGQLEKKGYEVLFDDRDLRPGQKFADADLIGIPVRLVLSDKTFAQNSLEVKLRTEKEASLISLKDFDARYAQKFSSQ